MTLRRSMTLTPVESTHLAGWKYEFRDFILTVQFRNGDIWEYSNIPEELIKGFRLADSCGSFFSTRIKPNFPGEKVHAGTLQDRAEIWLRSRVALDFEGSAVALSGSPVNVCAWMEAEKEQVLRDLYKGDDSVVVVQIKAKENQ